MRRRRRSPRPSPAPLARLASTPVVAVAGCTGGPCGSQGSWRRDCTVARGGWFIPPSRRGRAHAPDAEAWGERPAVLGALAAYAARPARRARRARGARAEIVRHRAAARGRFGRLAPANRRRAVACAQVHVGLGWPGCGGFSSSRTDRGAPRWRRSDRDVTDAIARLRSRKPVPPPRVAVLDAGEPPRAPVEPGRATLASPGADGLTPEGGYGYGTAGAAPPRGARAPRACRRRRRAAKAFISPAGTGGPAADDRAVAPRTRTCKFVMDRLHIRAIADRPSPSGPREPGGDVTGLSTDCYRHGDPSRTRSRSAQLNSSMFDRVARTRATSSPRIRRESCGSLAITVAGSGTSSSTPTGHTHCRNSHHAYFTCEAA